VRFQVVQRKAPVEVSLRRGQNGVRGSAMVRLRCATGITEQQQQNKAVRARLTSAKEQVCELRSARLIQANDFSIEHGISGAALQRKSKIQS
jgi:hypothetical protein